MKKRLLLKMHKKMLMIRLFEEKLNSLFLQGKIPGTLHLYNGQEACAVGVCENLNNQDWILSTHRPHGHAIAKGVSINSVMAELFANPRYLMMIRRTGSKQAEGEREKLVLFCNMISYLYVKCCLLV